MIMKMMGLRMDVYWLVTYIFNYAQYWFTVLFLWGHVLVMFSFVLSNFFSNSVTATAAVTLLWIFIVIPGSTVVGFLGRDTNTPAFIFPLLQVFPPMVMLRASLLFSEAASANEAITMSNMHTYADGAMGSCLLWFIVEYFILAVIMWYMEHAVATGHGVRKHPCFCCFPSFWTTRDSSKVSDSANAHDELVSERDRIEAEDLPESIRDTFRLQKD